MFALEKIPISNRSEHPLVTKNKTKKSEGID
jgi:hypothetical protein